MTIRDQLLATGIRRLGAPRNGFRYRGPQGGAVPAAVRRRIAALEIPPRWTEVVIAPSAGARVQAIGRDGAGRWQYLYHRAHATRRKRAKFERMVAFARALPALRLAIARDLRLPGLPRDKALAAAVAILERCLLRTGDERYAEENDSFGLATLRSRHVRVEGSRIVFDYRGKRGVRQRHEVRDRALARIVTAMLRLPGVELLKYREAHGRIRDVSRWHVNRYVKERMGQAFEARDFRTWSATLICAGALSRRTAASATASARRRAVTEALRETAAHLGNTYKVCRDSYVHPAVLRVFEEGRVVRHARAASAASSRRSARGLDRAERALLDLLERAEAPRSVKP